MSNFLPPGAAGVAKRRAARFVWTGILAALGLSTDASGQGPSSPPDDLLQMSLEDLMKVRVSSVSKKDQNLSKAAAAVSVITAEDIRRSGATNIPDLLRMVPGIHVAQMNANTWAISIRGFTDRYGDKVLVMIDGRSVYTPTSSGVNWDQQDVVLEDIERIEVIRGPGGTVWGANAVNGVINITTFRASASKGGLVTATAGSQRTAQSVAQYEGDLGGKGAYRVFGSYSNVGNSPSPEGEQFVDGWHKMHGGFRSDLNLSSQDTLTVQGDLFRSRESQTLDTLYSANLPLEEVIDDRIIVNSEDVLARWTHALSNGSSIIFQSYYDRYNRLDAGLGEIRNTFDADLQYHFKAGSRHDLVAGLGYRITGDTTTPGYAKSYSPAGRTDNLFSTFIQDEIKVTNALSLTVGSKFEHNAYTGFEYEPSAQLALALSSRQTVWASISRAIRQPAQADVALQHDVAVFPVDPGGFGVSKIVGTTGRKAERLHDFEVGYRSQINRRLSVDAAGFLSYYYGLQTAEPGVPYYTDGPSPVYLVVPTLSSDLGHARNYGVEISVNWSVTRSWRIAPGYSFIQMHVAGDPSSQDSGAGSSAYDTPKHQFQVHSLMNVTRHLEWDTALYQVGQLLDSGNGPTPGYERLDTRLGWRAGESIEFSIAGQNLLTPRHAEFHDDLMFHTLSARTIVGKITWRF
jgi:iron complex outermembrane receptor protein